MFSAWGELREEQFLFLDFLRPLSKTPFLQIDLHDPPSPLELRCVFVFRQKHWSCKVCQHHVPQA